MLHTSTEPPCSMGSWLSDLLSVISFQDDDKTCSMAGSSNLRLYTLTAPSYVLASDWSASSSKLRSGFWLAGRQTLDPAQLCASCILIRWTGVLPKFTVVDVNVHHDMTKMLQIQRFFYALDVSFDTFTCSLSLWRVVRGIKLTSLASCTHGLFIT